MTDSWPPTAASLVGRLFDAELDLMDRQVLDCDDSPVTVVDDVQLSDLDRPLSGADPPPVITALLSGAVVGTRIFGGRPPTSRLERISWADVKELGTVLRLRVPGSVLDVGWQERWVAEHVIGRIPGAHHDPE